MPVPKLSDNNISIDVRNREKIDRNVIAPIDSVAELMASSDNSVSKGGAKKKLGGKKRSTLIVVQELDKDVASNGNNSHRGHVKKASAKGSRVTVTKQQSKQKVEETEWLNPWHEDEGPSRLTLRDSDDEGDGRLSRAAAKELADDSDSSEDN